MITNQKQLIAHNLDFYNTFVDLKVTGWKTYSGALNKYTFGFFKPNLDEMDKSIEHMGSEMKDVAEVLMNLKYI